MIRAGLLVCLGLACIGLVAACRTETHPTAAAKAPPEQPVATAAPAKAEEAKPAVPELTEEDKRLISADPATLTPEERRKRAYSLRRKIMQNPDSPTAQMLEDLRRAAENGELKPPGKGGTAQFETRTLPAAKGGSPPAGTPKTDEGKATKAP
jgi:hypothetical protein